MTRSQLLAGLAGGWQIRYVPEAAAFLVMPANTESQCHQWLDPNLKIFGCEVRVSGQCFPKPTEPPIWETVLRLSNEGMKNKEIAAAINRSRSRVPQLLAKALRYQSYQQHNK
jgi:hypothetical protein